MNRVRSAVIGCGLIGERRARVIAGDANSACVLVADTNADAAKTTAAATGARVAASWQEIVESGDVDAVVVATPNALLAEIAAAALERGKHVLIEKPMGRDLKEAQRLAAAAAKSGRVLKVGFNHRYHPAIAEAHRRVTAGEIGDIINARCRYGHGGRPGYEKEWRGSRELAGGGELTDQGVHVVDLLHWFLGDPTHAFAVVRTAVWPLADLEDNAFAVFEFPRGAVAMLHTSWTQWKNLFSFEIHGRVGSLIVEGLGRSYGEETLTRHLRNAAGGAPTSETWRFPGEDESWRLEWEDFVRAVRGGGKPLGGVDDGVAAMRMLDALYRSASSGVRVTLDAQA